MGYSRWVLADLQVHTPADFHHRFGNVGGPEPNAAFADVLIKAHADAGVGVIAVTDHNTLAWYPVLAEAGQRHGVVVFPGIEFNVNKCHLMAIWECDDGGYRRGQQFLHHLFPPDCLPPLTQRREPNPTNVGSPLQLAKIAAESYGALVLAPHSTAVENGLFGRGVCNTSDQVAQSEHVLGFDVYGKTHADVLTNPRRQFGDRHPAWFISGDLRDLESAGKRAVYLKLGTPPTLESLRQAFLMPAHRIRFPQHLHGKYHHVTGARFLDGPTPSWPRITRIGVDGGFHDGLGVELGPGLNAIIGGKGTGKSTAIEIIRHTCGAVASTVEDNNSNRRANFTPNANAVLGVVAADGHPYEITRSGDSTPPVLLRSGIATAVEVSRRFSVNIFGQRELAELADRQDALREFVALSAEPEFDAARAAETGCLSELGRLNAEITSVEAALETAAASEETLNDLQDQLAELGQRGAVEQVAASKALTAAEEQATTLHEWLAGLAQLGQSLRAAGKQPSVDAHDTIPAELTAHADWAEHAVSAAADLIDAAAEQISADLPVIIQRHGELAQTHRHQINVALAEAGLADPEELAVKQRAAADLERAVAAVPGQRRQLELLRTERALQIDSLHDDRALISAELQAAASRLSDRVGGRVRVSVQPAADRAALRDLLSRATAGQNILSAQLTRLAEAGPAAIVAAINSGIEQLIKLGVSEGTANKLRALAPDKVREIEQCATPDLITVEINLAPEAEVPRWTDVRRVSPGQRATAMLSLVLATGDDPLIIDQPEDDLDNRFIYDHVVRQLTEVADRRQVIVATHNPNIPILGDAELILALDATVDRSSIVACGAIDDPAVAEAARRILEGGDAAFRARARRYRAAA
ncbi:TrlF family AAA-like ATPase [Catellatospora citrea]|uniref:TrlF family AAA-like ATPase n=1 Tax=Catellatospora citrea TaxID=53366 RepID=UPI0011C36CA1|nr:hypothetical protein [Catellatospora citrea]